MDISPIKTNIDVKADLTKGVTRIVDVLGKYFEIPLKVIDRVGKTGGLLIAIADEKLEQKRLDIKYESEQKREGNGALGIIHSKQEFNLRGVISKAIEASSHIEVINEGNVVSEEWLNFFFEAAKNISDDQLQQLWAKILAGEVANPDSFSIRTFDVLKTITKSEAESFTKLARYAFTDGGGTSFVIVNDKEQTEELYQLSFANRMSLQESGLIHSTDTTIPIIGKQGGQVVSRVHLIYGEYEVEILSQGTENSGFTSYVPTLTFTKVGSSLCKLIDHSNNLETIKTLSYRFRGEGVEIMYRKIGGRDWNKLETK